MSIGTQHNNPINNTSSQYIVAFNSGHINNMNHHNLTLNNPSQRSIPSQHHQQSSVIIFQQNPNTNIVVQQGLDLTATNIPD